MKSPNSGLPTQSAVEGGRGLSAASATQQRLVIEDWHPRTSANRSHDHWRKIQQAHHHDRDVAWVNAKHAGWVFVPGKVRLTITLVYARKYRLDADNLAAKCKGLIDGLKRPNRGISLGVFNSGWFQDDSTEWLELVVRAEVRPGVKATELTLEALP